MENNLKYVQSPEDLVKWVTHAKRGDKVCYYRGWLMREKLGKLPYMVRTNSVSEDFLTTDKAWDFYEMGVVELVQKKVSDEDYLYLAVCK